MDSATALAELKNFQSTRKGAGDYYDKYQKDLGVGEAKTRADDIRGLIRNTETALKGVGESVAGRTRGQLVTEAQRARLQNIEREPLLEGLSGLQGSYADESQTYRDLLGQAGTRAQLAYQTDADRLSALESNYNKLFTNEQAAEERRRWEAQMAEQKRAAAAQERLLAQQASLYNTPASVNKGATTNPLQQNAYNNVLDFINQGQGAAKSDYAATAKSAGYGNVMDKMKIELYHQLRPQWFTNSIPVRNLNIANADQLRF